MRKIILVVIALLLAPVNANAHAGLVSSNPSANSEITLMPDRIELTFTENLMILGEKQINKVTMDGPAGEIALAENTVEGAVLSATIPTNDFPSGTYAVSYSIISADGHKLSESFSFTLNAPTPFIAPAPEDNDGNGVLPLPIVGAIAIAVIAGLFIAFGRRNRSE